MTRNSAAINIDGEVFLPGQTFDPDIGGPFDGVEDLDNLIRGLLEALKVIAKDLDRDIRADAGHHFINPIGNGLGHHHLDTGDHTQGLSNGRHDPLLIPSRGHLIS